MKRGLVIRSPIGRAERETARAKVSALSVTASSTSFKMATIALAGVRGGGGQYDYRAELVPIWRLQLLAGVSGSDHYLSNCSYLRIQDGA